VKLRKRSCSSRLSDVSKRRWLFGGLALTVFWISTSLAPQKSVSPSVATQSPVVAVNKNKIQPSTLPQTIPTAPATKIPDASLPSLSSNSVFPPVSESKGVISAAIPKLEAEKASSLPTTLPSQTAGDQKQVASGNDHVSSSGETAQPVQERSDPKFISNRLHKLGYLEAESTTNSVQVTQAIRDIKVVNGLSQNDQIDIATIRLLNTGSPLSAQQSFLGGWSMEASCSQGTEMEISSTLAKTEAGSCKFNRILLERNGWKVQARCQVASETWVANITFRVVGRRLEWISERGRQIYHRCG
jgi:hypothetical protein